MFDRPGRPDGGSDRGGLWRGFVDIHIRLRRAGRDRCGTGSAGIPVTALTRAEVEAATYPQGTAVFDSNDRQKDAGTHLPVVCQWLVKFNGAPSTVGVVVSLMDDSDYARRAVASMVAPPVALTGIGAEAFLVQSAPGMFEVYVSAKNGKFKLGAQDKATATALAKIAAGRD